MFNLNKVEKNLGFIWYELMDQKSRMLAKRSLVRVLLGAALFVAVPYAIGFFIDGLTNQTLDALLVGGLLFLSLELSSVALGWFRQQVREHFFQHAFWYIPHSITRMYYSRPLAWLSGSTSEIDGGGVESLREKVWNVIGSYIFTIIPGWGLVVFALGACLYAQVWLGSAACLYVVVHVYFGRKDNRHIHSEMKPIIDLFKRWERRMQEWWRNVDHVKNQGVESKMLVQTQREVQHPLSLDDAVWRVFFARAIVYHRLRSLAFAAVMYGLVGYFVFTDMISLAVAVLVFFSFERIRNTLGELNDQAREVQFNLAGIAKYRRVLRQEVPFHYDQGDDFSQDTMSVAYKNVCHDMGNDQEKKRILHDVNLVFKPGEKIGIVGPSGAGKSQLVSLLVRSTDPVSGQVEVGGRDIRDVRLESLLRYYGVIMQKSEPFDDSVLGNLLFGVSHLDLPCPYEEMSPSKQREIDECARESLEKAGLGLDVFPNGIHTHIGYKGLKLSGGQQQRLQIAAAHMKLAMNPDKPRLVIADEPTASLDSLSELTVMAHLQDSLPRQTTMLMVAHRLSTVSRMDRIVFVRPLECVQEGQDQVTIHDSLGKLYCEEALFRQMADSQGFRP